MASLQIKIQPFEIPDYVNIQVPGGDEVEVPISELDGDTLAAMIEEFATAVMEKAKQ